LFGGISFFLIVFFILKESNGNITNQSSNDKIKKDHQEDVFVDTYSRNEKKEIEETIFAKVVTPVEIINREEMEKKHQDEYERWRFYFNNQASNLHGFNVEIDDTQSSKESSKIQTRKLK